MKKRMIAVLSVLVLLFLPLSACTPEVPIPTLSDCGAVEGMLMHTSTTKYTYSESDGIVSTKNSLFLPAGSVIESEMNIAVYPYDQHNTLDKALLAESGQGLVGDYMVMMAPGAVTLTKDAYVRVAVHGTLEDVSITVPEERRAEVMVFDTAYEAYQKDYDRILPLVEQAGKDAVNYIFITDIHNDQNSNSAAQRASLKKQVETAVKLANESDSIDFIVVGGDNTSGHYPDKATTISYNHAVFAPLKECKKPVLMLMGNHDDNSYSAATQLYDETMAANLISKVQWNKEHLQTYVPNTVVHDSKNADSAYYYYDLTAKKTRLVCLDAIDYVQETDENGVIRVDSLAQDADGNSLVGRNYWGYSARQLQWLAEEALTAVDGWNYVFFSHMNVQESYAYGTELHDLLKAFNDRTVYSNDELGTLDFTAATGEILIYQYGHVHVERMTEDAAIGAWRVSTSSANIALLSNNKKGTEGYRAFGTDSECCFDVMVVGKDVVKKYAFGAGKDAELTK